MSQTTQKHMTVNQLIKLLSEMPQDAPILIPGYEGGNTSVTDVRTAFAVRDETQSWYYGEWRNARDKEISTEAVVIGGERHG